MKLTLPSCIVSGNAIRLREHVVIPLGCNHQFLVYTCRYFERGSATASTAERIGMSFDTFYGGRRLFFHVYSMF